MTTRLVCGERWENTELLAYPHQCVIRDGFHVQHCCHCGAQQRLTGQEHVDIAVRLSHRAPAASPPRGYHPTCVPVDGGWECSDWCPQDPVSPD